MRYYTVYKTTNLINNKIYIGKKIVTNLNNGYLGSGKNLINDIKIYGRDKFKKEILYIFDNLKESTAMEKKIVNKEFLSRTDVYNLNNGGNGGWYYINKLRDADPSIRSEIGRLGGKVSGKINGPLSKKEKKGIFSPEVIKKMSTYRHNETIKKRIGEANSKHQKGIKNSRYGTKWIYNDKLKKSKSVDKEYLQNYLNNGYKLGRKMKF